MLYAYRFLDNLVLLYPVYTLLFADTGLTVWQISALFVIWSLATIVFEVPSGAWADSTSRRRLLVGAPLLTAVAFGLWVYAPGFWVFVLGFLLWGLKTALTSGALEALVYEELSRYDAESRYAAVMGRAEVGAVAAVTIAGLVAAPVFTAGGYVVVGLASVAVSVLAAVTALLFPEFRACDDEDELGWSTALQHGVGEARRSRTVRHALILVVVVASVWGALDEFTPLLVESFDVDVATVSLLMVVVWAGAAIGGLLAERLGELDDRGFALLLSCGAVLLGGSGLLGHPVAVLGLAAGFGVMQLATVIADARLQHSITGPARATVTSLAGMSTDALTLVVYGSYALAGSSSGHATAFAVLSLPYLVAAAWLRRPRIH